MAILSPVSAFRSTKSVLENLTEFAPAASGSVRSPSAGILTAVGCGHGLLSAKVKLARRSRTLKKVRRGGEDRTDSSISSSSSQSSVSYTEEASEPLLDHSDGGNNFNGRGGGHGGGGGGGDNGFGGSENSGPTPGERGGIFGSLLKGWDDRVRADPQFAFKVLMEEIVGVGMCVAGDMATRPNFGLDELDLVFSTLVVGSILNFLLMYMLAPTAAAGAVSSKLPGLFAGSPAGHMFEPGAYSLFQRFGTFVYKGTIFAGVGFCAGIVGTGISSGLISAREKMDSSYVNSNPSPPILLNALTWAAHMGFSSNARYQSLNGLEFVLAKTISPGIFKLTVPVLRGLNNILGGASFVALARLTGSQPSDSSSPPTSPEDDESNTLDDVVPVG
jgi:hypothetical protein